MSCPTCGFLCHADFCSRCFDRLAAQASRAAGLVFDRVVPRVCACGHSVGMHWHRPKPEECDSPGCGCAQYTPAWRSWFDGEVFLGTRSSRTAPDPVDAKQKCGCDQCSESIVAAVNGPPLNERTQSSGKARMVSSSSEFEEIDGQPKP